MSAPLGTAVRDAAREQLRRELAVRLTAAHDAVLRRVPDLYRRIVGEALLVEDGQTGKAAQLRTAQRALDRIARIGVVDFVDQAGRRWNMQSYVEMAVRTAALGSMVDAQMRTYRERGIEYVYVTNVAGQCELCRPWEGQVLAIDPSPEPRVTTSAASDGSTMQHQVTATVADAIAAGLMHPNCRHRVVRLEPGRTVIPPATPDPQAYEDQQRLRALERQVRAWRRREAAAITPEARENARRKVADWQGAIREHVAATGVRRLREREQISRPLTSPTPRRRVDQAIADVDRAARDAAEARRREAVERREAAELRAREEAERLAAVERAAQEAEEARQAQLDADSIGLEAFDTSPEQQQANASRVEAHYQQTTGGRLTDAEREAVRMYTHERYSRINAGLRNGSPDPRDADVIAGVDAAMAKYTLPEPITVWRGLRTFNPPPNLPAGHILDGDAYASTGMTRDVFSGIQMEITIPAGSHGVAANGANPGGLSEAEREFILPRGTRFAVISDQEIGGQRWLKVDALPPADSTPADTPAAAESPPAELTGSQMQALKDAYDTAVADMSRDEKDALWQYTSMTGYAYMNGLIRGREFQLPPVMRDRFGKNVEALARLFERYQVPETMTVWRRVGGGVIPDDAVVGSVIDPAGHHSTSMSEAGSSAWAELPVVMRIVVPQGMNAIVVGGREDELILPHGTRFAITDIEERDGRRWLTMTALPPNQ